MKHWNRYFYGLGMIPLIYSAALLTFYFHARLILGQFPKYNQPDPKSIGIYWDYSTIIELTGNIWIYSLALWLIFTVIYLIVKRKKVNWRPIVISALGQISAIMLLMSEVMEWYAD